MLIGTHALLPVCGCLIADHVSLASGGERIFAAKAWWLIGIFGILPDILSPHILLDARHTSYTHSVWFMGAALVLAALTGMFFDKGERLYIATACACGTGLHLIADALSGGIAWLYPWRKNIIGDFLIDSNFWLGSDAAFIILTWIFIRTLPYQEARNILKSHSKISS